jgi:hypothetical protein
MVFKLVTAAAKTWRRLKGENQLPKIVQGMECAPGGGQIAGWELTGTAGLSEDESHGQASQLQH